MRSGTEFFSVGHQDWKPTAVAYSNAGEKRELKCSNRSEEVQFHPSKMKIEIPCPMLHCF